MDFGDLRDRMEAGDLSVGETLWMGTVLAKTVADIHNLGIRHLDIKPRNVLFKSTPDGEWPVPKIGDWGLARLQLEHSGSMEALSTCYAAPEQFDSDEFGDVDHRTDIYQLASVLYESLTGTPAFDGQQYSLIQNILGSTPPEPPSKVNPDLPEAVDEPILKGLSREKDNRHDHMLYFRDQIRDVFEDVSEDRL
jgi:serine/threonine protein kinase